MTGWLVMLCAVGFSGARGSVGDLVEPPAEDTEPTVVGVSCTGWRRAVVAGVAGNPDRMRGVALIAFRVSGGVGAEEASEAASSWCGARAWRGAMVMVTVCGGRWCFLLMELGQRIPSRSPASRTRLLAPGGSLQRPEADVV